MQVVVRETAGAIPETIEMEAIVIGAHDKVWVANAGFDIVELSAEFWPPGFMPIPVSFPEDDRMAEARSHLKELFVQLRLL